MRSQASYSLPKSTAKNNEDHHRFVTSWMIGHNRFNHQHSHCNTTYIIWHLKKCKKKKKCHFLPHPVSWNSVHQDLSLSVSLRNWRWATDQVSSPTLARKPKVIELPLCSPSFYVYCLTVIESITLLSLEVRNQISLDNFDLLLLLDLLTKDYGYDQKLTVSSYSSAGVVSSSNFHYNQSIYAYIHFNFILKREVYWIYG